MSATIQRGLLLLAVLMTLLLAAACASAAPTPFPTNAAPTLAPAPTLNPDGDAEHGQILFSQWRCADCHGDSAQGGVGPNLARPALSVASFTSAVRQTRPPKPSFSETELSNQDVLDIYTWLRGLDALAVSLAGTEAASLPEGEVLGIGLYTRFGCDSCHGAFAQGGINAPSLAGYSSDVDTFRSAMSMTTTSVPEHDLTPIDADLLRRLYHWLREGADPDGGC